MPSTILTPSHVNVQGPSAGEPSSRLAYLPLDILVQIQGFMDASDIISFRQTCKSVATATRERTVWLEALRRVCVVNSVFSPTFPLEEMTHRALEHAATSSFRFVNLLMKKDTPVHPFATRLLNSRSMAGDGELEDCRLVPGGRFLITRSANSTIHLWDLGYTSEAMIKPFPIASINEGAQILILDLQPTVDHMGIRLMLSSTGSLADTNSILVYEVYPLSVCPSFQMIASLEGTVHSAEVFTSSQDLIAVYHDYWVMVWNFVLDSVVTWEVDMNYEAIKLFKDHIILFDLGWFTLWNIPPLRPRVYSGPPPEAVAPQTPVWAFSHPQKGTFDRVSVPPSSWPQHTGRPTYFSLSTYDGENTIAYYMMKPTGNQEHDGVPSFIPVLMAGGVTRDFNGGDLYGDIRFCDNWLVQPWVEEERIVVNMTRIPTTRQEDTLSQTLLLWGSHRFSDALQCFDFCPVSGRLCCSVDDNGYELRVMDYIVPL